MRKTFSVLYLEDNPGDALLLTKLLADSETQFNFILKESLEGGLEYLKFELPDIILIDLGLTDSSGITGIKKLLEQVPNACIIVLTGSQNIDLGKIAVAEGAQDFLNKNNLTPDLLEKTLLYAYERNNLISNIRSSENQLKEVYNSVKSIIFKVLVKSEEEFSFVMANEPFFRAFGLDYVEIGEIPIENVLPEKILSSVKSHFREAISKKKEVTWQETAILNNKKRTGLITVIPGFNIRGECDYLIGSVEDLTEIRRVVSDLEQNRSFLQAIFQYSLNAIIVLDDQGNFTAVNKTAEELFDLPEEKLLQMSFYNIKMQQNSFRQYFEQLLMKQKLDGEFHFYDQSDRRKVAIFHAIHVKKNLNIFSMHDITKRVEYQEEIRKLSLIATETTNAAIITNKKSRITWVNRAFEKMTGYTLDEAKGRIPGSILQGPESNRDAIKLMLQKERARQPFSAEVINYKKDGTKYWVKIDGQPIFDESGEFEGYFALETDITERIRYEQEILDRKNQLNLAIDAGSLGVLDWDFSSEKYIANDIFYKFISYEPEHFEPTYKNFISVLVHADDQSHIEKSLKRLFNRQTESFNEKFKIITGNHEVKWVDMKGNLFFEQDKPGRFISIVIDITREVKTEEAILSATIEAQELEKERMSREIHDGLQQTILTAKLNFESAWRKEIKKQDRYDLGMKYISKAIEETRELAYSLIPKDLANFGLAKSINNLVEAISQSTNIVFYENLKDRRMKKMIELGLFRITQEALTNALKHAEANEIFVQLIYQPSGTSLTIEDNGKGFNPEGGKLNYGIDSIRNRAKSIGGRCEIHSAPGKGTFLSVEIPEDTIFSD